MRQTSLTLLLCILSLIGRHALAEERTVNPPKNLSEVQQACTFGLEALQDGNLEAALEQARTAGKLAEDSLGEAHSTTMELSVSTMDRAAKALQAKRKDEAIRQFQRCGSLLDPEITYYKKVLGEAAVSPKDDEAKLMSEMATVEVTAAASSQKSLVGSGMVVDEETLFKSHVFTPNEALRKVPGVNVRDEEGFGIRPNISIRGSNPFRSTKILFLEDGLLFNFAPYGDNDMYYTPPIDRFVGVEVFKGADLTKYGPQTVFGAVNYITADVPKEAGGFASFTGGNRAYLNGHLRYGGMIDKAGGLFEYLHKEGDAARDNSFVALDDVYLKGLWEIDAQQSLTVRGDFYREDSQATFGITEAELRNFGYRYNPFKNDHYDTQRWANTATHQYKFSDDATLMTNFYWSQFSRDWWRQMNQQPTDTQCGLDFREKRLNGQPIDVDACNFTRGRLRDYYAWGVEPRLHVKHSLFGVTSELDTGFRAHYEAQHRLTEDANTPIARSGLRIEDNDRFAEAYSGFFLNRFILGDWSITPGVRVESVSYLRTNKLPGQAAQGESSLTEALPSFALTYAPIEQVNLFFGVHRGFAPPRVEDSVYNDGSSVEIGPETSWNYEVGMRTWPRNGVQADLTLFRNDFDRYTALGTVGGNDTPVAQGQALFQGMEIGGRVDGAEVFNWVHNPYLQLAYTWLPTAVQSSAFQCLPLSNGTIPATCPGGYVYGSRAGNRQPYAPEQLVTATVGYSHPIGVDVRLETVFTADQYSDFMNLTSGADHPNGPNSIEARSGQYGMIPASTIFNFAATYLVQKNLSLYATIKNVFDHEYIVDRVRGILPGSPRLVQAGFRYDL
jgi:Fe(3+) dicitrate transport protein